jgi:hypothetical protein
MSALLPIVLKKSFWGVERKFLEPLMRFMRSDVRDHIVSHKTTTDLRIGAKEGCNRRDSSESIFARFSASSDFRLLQQTLTGISGKALKIL